MRTWLSALAAPLWLAAAPAPPKPTTDALRHPGETTVFAFGTAGGKTASLCEGPGGAYLVYRFGTAAKTELQYPAVLDASSWRRFTYMAYHRGGGVANAGMEDYRLSFRNGGAAYELYDVTRAVAGKGGVELYPREVGIDVAVAKGKSAVIAGRASTASGSLYLDDEQRQRVKLAEDE